MKRKEGKPMNSDSPVKVTPARLCVRCGEPEGSAKYYCDRCVDEELTLMLMRTESAKKRRKEGVPL